MYKGTGNEQPGDVKNDQWNTDVGALCTYTCGNAQMNVLKVRKALRKVLHELGELRAFRPTVSRIGAAGVNRIQVAQIR